MTFTRFDSRAHLGLVMLGLVTAVCAAGDARAAEPATRTVSYADLDLTNAMGRDTLDRRLTNAARSVCGARGTSNLASMTQERTCMDASLASARAKAQSAAARQALARTSFISQPGL